MGGGEEEILGAGGGVKAISDWLEGGAKLFYKEV